MNDQEILKVARELAAKSGISFDNIPATDIMRNAYLHNAEEAIKDRRMKSGPTGVERPAFTCPRCQDKAYIGGERCQECNPMGLSVDEVHPGAVVEVDTASQYMREANAIADALMPWPPPGVSIDIGSGPPLEEDTNVPKPAATPKKGEYLCTKCNTIHRQTSVVGKKHLEVKQ